MNMALHIMSDRYLTLPEVEERVLFSGTHIYRLERRGEFPCRVLISERRVVWREKDVTQWMQNKLDARLNAEARTLCWSDRFIDTKAVTKFTSLSRQQIDRLEKRGEFPIRVQIGEGRVAWLENEVRSWSYAGVAPMVWMREQRA